MTDIVGMDDFDDVPAFQDMKIPQCLIVQLEFRDCSMELASTRRVVMKQTHKALSRVESKQGLHSKACERQPLQEPEAAHYG